MGQIPEEYAALEYYEFFMVRSDQEISEAPEVMLSITMIFGLDSTFRRKQVEYDCEEFERQRRWINLPSSFNKRGNQHLKS